MAVTLDATSNGGYNPSTATLTWSHTCTGSNLFLVVFAYTFADTVTGVTYNGVGMTKVGSSTQLPGGGNYMTVWKLASPATGAHNIVVTCSGSTGMAGVAESVTGGRATLDSNSATTSAPATTTFAPSDTTTASNCWLIMACGVQFTLDPTAGANTTFRLSQTNIGLSLFDSNGAVASGSNTLNATLSSSTDWVGAIVAIQPTVTAQLASASTFTFSTSPTLRGRSNFAATPTFKFSTTPTLRARSSFAASPSFHISTSSAFIVGLTVFVNNVDVTRFVRRYESEITETLNQGVPQASVVVRGITPVEGQTVTIMYGSTTLFSGQIIDLTLIRAKAGRRVRYRLECDQWGKLIDRRLIYSKSDLVSASSVVAALVGTYASGFTSTNVEASLASITWHGAGARMTLALTQIAALIGAVAKILPSKDIYFRVTGNLTAPATLDTTNTLYKSLQYRRRLGQVRTRVFGKGVTVSTLTDVILTQLSIPVTSVTPFTGATVYDVNGLRYTTGGTFVTGGIGSALASSAAAGASSVTLNDTTNFQSTGWVFIDGQYIYHSGRTIGVNGTLTGIPPIGAGAITAAIASAASVIQPAQVIVVALLEAVPAGASVQLVVQQDDATAQTTIAGLEGGDGIHEFDVEDQALANTGSVQSLAIAELTVGKNVLEEARFISEDQNAQVGASQAINAGGVNTTLPITSTRIYWKPGRRKPQRDVTAATVERTAYQFLADVALLSWKLGSRSVST